MRLEIVRTVLEVLAGFLREWRRVQLGVGIVVVAINAHDSAARTRRGRQQQTIIVGNLLAELVHTHDAVGQRFGGDLRFCLARRNGRSTEILRVGAIKIGVLIGPLRSGHTWTTDCFRYQRLCVAIDRRVVPTISKQVIVAGSLAIQRDVLAPVAERPEQEGSQSTRRMLDGHGYLARHDLVHARTGCRILHVLPDVLPDVVGILMCD
ncbi:hypothetical protein D3C75_624030 [compost metagenome]